MHNNRFMLGDITLDTVPTETSSTDTSGISDVFGNALDDLTQYKIAQQQSNVASQQVAAQAIQARSSQTLLIGAALILALVLVAKR